MHVVVHPDPRLAASLVPNLNYHRHKTGCTEQYRSVIEDRLHIKRHCIHTLTSKNRITFQEGIKWVEVQGKLASPKLFHNCSKE
jgi:hypothetical protein